MTRGLRVVTTAALVLVIPASAQGQSMSGMDMPGMRMPTPTKNPATKKASTKGQPPKAASRPGAAARGAAKPKRLPAKKGNRPRAVTHDAMPEMNDGQMQGMPMPGSTAAPNAQEQPMPGMQMPGMDMSKDQLDGHDMQGVPTGSMNAAGTGLPAGNAPAPAAPADHYGDRYYPSAEMTRTRMEMMREQGGHNFYQVLFNLAELQVRNGRNGYRWDGQAWFGGDINRLTLKSEGEGTFRRGVDGAEVQALYSRAIGPYTDIQAGIRYDFEPKPSRTYATIGFQTLAPGFFELGGALFLSNKGDLLGRLEGLYDQRITQRLILQPRVELNFAAQNVPETRIGSGMSNAELGLRLRYEIKREFAPYIGVSWDRKTGDTARFHRAAGEKASSKSFVAGIRTWF
jgi:copper resistance protein B